MSRSRDEHLAWAKERALRYLDVEHDPHEAFSSMTSDLGKHPELKCPEFLALTGMMFVMSRDEPALRRWIEGFQ